MPWPIRSGLTGALAVLVVLLALGGGVDSLGGLRRAGWAVG